MKNITSGFYGNLADISIGPEITPLHMEKEKCKMAQKNSGSQLVLNQNIDFTLATSSPKILYKIKRLYNQML